MRGYFGIGVYRGKSKDNFGTLWRSAKLLGASFIFTIAGRYPKQRTDTMKAVDHLPLFEFDNWDNFKKSIPSNSLIICVEQIEGSKNIKSFSHPERAVYVLGAEDDGIPSELCRGNPKVFIDTPRSLNVAVAGSIILYDRLIKLS